MEGAQGIYPGGGAQGADTTRSAQVNTPGTHSNYISYVTPPAFSFDVPDDDEDLDLFSDNVEDFDLKDG